MIVWRVSRLQGGSESVLTADLELTPSAQHRPWSRAPIEVDFRVLMYTASGLLVRYLKVIEKSNYQSIKWVRYLTQSTGSYLVRF